MISERVQEQAISSFENLIGRGKSILSSCGWDGESFAHHRPDSGDYLRFRTEALNLVKRICGESSSHFQELYRLAESNYSLHSSHLIVHFLGVVEAAKHDLENGLLLDMRALISAELLGDFIDQAELLLNQGYYVPAASLAGAVLEDTLRKLCELQNILVAEKTKIDRLNVDLVKAGIYNKLVQKRITVLADIRNNADHGHFDEFKREDVDDMVKWIRRFTSDFLR